MSTGTSGRRPYRSPRRTAQAGATRAAILDAARTAFLEAGYVQSVGSNTGQNYELDAISACIVGGVSFAGGVGTVAGVVIGSIILTAINFSLIFLQINPYVQYIVRGLIIIIAVSIDVRKYIAKK